MRSRSGNLRWDHTWMTLALVLLAVCTELPSTAAGPTRSRRQLFTSKELTNENVQAEETCMLNGKEELRSSVQCSPKPGCRKIEIRDECCPLYKCDCQFNDRTFENNEKISDPSTPCHVCLCRGGEIKCTTVTCYNRNDCANTTFVDGVCCPQYDNCPPLEDNNLGAAKDSSPAADTAIAVSTKEQLLATTTPTTTTTTSSPSSTTVATSVEQFSNDNPLGIKIKEITKPEEIRITDDKPKQFKPPTRATTSTASVTPAGQFSTAGPSSMSGVVNDIILPEFESSGSEILPEDDIQPELTVELSSSSSSSESTTSDIVDDLSQFESTDDRFMEPIGVKSIRQTENVDNIGELSTASSTTDSGLSDHSQQQPSSTESSSSSSSSTLDSADLFTSPSPVSIGAETTENSQLIYIKGKPFKIREVDGLTRGNDDEDEIKAGRKSSSNAENMLTTIASLTDDLSVLTTSTAATSIEGSGNTVVYDTEYHEVVSDDGSASSAVFDTKLASSEEQLNMHIPESGSHEFIDVLHLDAVAVEFDGSGAADRVGLFTEQPEVEGSNDESATGAAVSIAVASVTVSDSTSDSPISSTPNILQFQQVHNNDNDDKTREFPEQSDDYSVHGRMQNEDLGKSSNVVALAGDETDADTESEDAFDSLRVIPISRMSSVVTELSTASPPTSEIAPSSYSDVQERSPGEPFLIPEWERNATTESAVQSPKINRKDSLILLPVNDVAEYGVHTVAGHSGEEQTIDVLSTSTTGKATVMLSNESPAEEVTSSSTAPSAELLNEVAEARSVDDGFADQLFGNSKLKYYFHAPGEFFRYQDKIMNS